MWDLTTAMDQHNSRAQILASLCGQGSDKLAAQNPTPAGAGQSGNINIASLQMNRHLFSVLQVRIEEGNCSIFLGPNSGRIASIDR